MVEVRASRMGTTLCSRHTALGGDPLQEVEIRRELLRVAAFTEPGSRAHCRPRVWSTGPGYPCKAPCGACGGEIPRRLGFGSTSGCCQDTQLS